MTTPTSAKNLDGYGAPLIPWEKVRASLDADTPQAPGTGGPNRHTFWLTTINPDGSPHVVPVGMFWDGESHWFTSGDGTRKSRNLAADPRCAVTVAVEPFDLIVEGRAEKVTDRDAVRKLAEIARNGGWPAEEENGALTAPYSAPAAGPAPWYAYKITPNTVYAMATAEPGGATRFDL